jgi:hypothetical protein
VHKNSGEPSCYNNNLNAQAYKNLLYLSTG